MSQYPNSPYVQPQFQHPYAPGVQSPDDIRRPARWAGGMMLTVGILLLAMGGCCAIVGIAGPGMKNMPPETAQMAREFNQATGADLWQIVTGSGVIIAVVAIFYILIAIFVIQAKDWANIVGSILTGILLIATASFAVFGLIGLSKSPSGAPTICVAFVAVVVLLIMMVLHVKAWGVGAKYKLAQAQMLAQHQQAAQWWQYQQHQAWMNQQQPPPAVSPTSTFVPPPPPPPQPRNPDDPSARL